MLDWLTDNETSARLIVFIGVFVLLALLEIFKPRRRPAFSRSSRWFTNFSMTALNAITIRLLFLALQLAGAWDAQREGWGLFNALRWPVWLEVVLVLLVFDLVIYVQHVASHKIPILWRVHKVHHSDPDFDVTTAIRFHPIEILLSMLLKLTLVYLLGPVAAAVVLFEIILNASAMFNHSNLAIPLQLDRWLRLVVVTPDMHRVHHSVLPQETDANYGFNVPWWDRLFRTYIAQPREGHERMRIGLTEHQNTKPTRLGWTLRLPFSTDPKDARKN